MPTRPMSISQIPSMRLNELEDSISYAINPVTTVLTCHFLFELRQADRTGMTPSSPSAMSSLDFNVATDSQRSRGTLPAFFASMGSQISTGLHFEDPAGGDEDAATGTADEQGSASGEESGEERNAGRSGSGGA
ncbi:hypothetical protein V8D89_012536 [Ganoderma adspersum]